MNCEHLTVYYDPEYMDRDGKCYCVDEDHPDNENGTRSGGDIGNRFNTPEEAGHFVTQWLRENNK